MNLDARAGRAERDRRAELLVAVAVTIGLVVATMVVAVSPVGGRWNGDVQTFHHYAGTFLEGFVSRTSYLAWYPPLTLVPFTFPRLLAADLPGYTLLFALEMSIAAGAMVLLVAAVARRASVAPVRWVLVTLVILVALSVVVLPWRYDVLPALCTAGALLAVVSGRPAIAGMLLGIGAALKVYPAVLVAPIVLWLWYRGERGGAVRAAAGFAVAAGLGFALYLFFPPASPLDLLAFQGGRGLQLEGLAASFVEVAVLAGAVARPQVAYRDGSYNLVGPASDIGLRISGLLEPALLAIAIAVTWWSLARRARAEEPAIPELVMGMAAVLLALMLGNRVFSPQYMVWLIPFVALLMVRMRWVAGVAFALTAAVFPLLYDGLMALEPGPVLVLLLRNSVLAALFCWLLAALLRHGRPAVQTGPSG